jgi:hypothetical protein
MVFFHFLSKYLLITSPAIRPLCICSKIVAASQNNPQVNKSGVTETFNDIPKPPWKKSCFHKMRREGKQVGPTHDNFTVHGSMEIRPQRSTSAQRSRA